MNDAISKTLDDLSRREFLRLGGLTAVGIGIQNLEAQTAHPHAASMIAVPFTAGNSRVGIIGTGGRGTSLLENLLAADVKVLALCDVVREKAEHAQSLVVKAGQSNP